MPINFRADAAFPGLFIGGREKIFPDDGGGGGIPKIAKGVRDVLIGNQ